MLSSCSVYGQSTFKCGWTTYKTVMIIHEYTYSYTYKDSFKLYLADSTKTFVAPDSAALLTIDYPFHDNVVYKEASYLNGKKKVIKTEQYRDNLLTGFKEFKYDDKNRKTYEYEENKEKSSNYKKLFDFATDKSTGDFTVNETSYFNGRLEFYTKSFYNSANQKYKEVRLNDNNKDIVHVENFTYGVSGRVRERSVYFPEFKVTKTFPEPGGDDPAKCYKMQAINIPEKASLSTKVGYLKKLLSKNLPLIMDKDCHDFEYKFISPDCEVVISTVKTNNIKQIVFRFKEKQVSK